MPALRIGELLIQEGLLTPSQLQSALAAQRIFGGRLGTNLVEHGFVSETDLARLLARQLGIRMVEPNDLNDVPHAILELLPDALARKYNVLPFRLDEKRDRLALAMADPNNLQAVDELQFALGKKVDFHICPEILLAYAMEKYYGIARPRRFIKLSGVADAELQLFHGDGKRRPAPRAAQAAAPAASGTLTPESMLARIVDAPGKQELVASVTDMLSRFAEQLVFFVVRGEDLVAWNAAGVNVPSEQLRQVVVPLAGSRLLADVVGECRPVQAEVPLGDPIRTALEDRLFVDCRGPVSFLPLVLNRKTVGLFALVPRADAAEGEARLLTELVKRVAYRLQVFYLMEQLAAPL